VGLCCRPIFARRGRKRHSQRLQGVYIWIGVDDGCRLLHSVPVTVLWRLRRQSPEGIRCAFKQCRSCPRNCKRRADADHGHWREGAGKARQQRRPVSQETCRDRDETSSGGVSRWCACVGPRPRFSARVRSASAPSDWGSSRCFSYSRQSRRRIVVRSGAELRA
jgi:hypothetical protein